MATECYAMVRGSAVRVTGLGARGSLPDTIPFAVSKSVAKVTINEVTTSGADEMLGSEQEDNDNRIRLVRPTTMVNYTVDLDFLRVDPGVLALMVGVPLVYKNQGGGFGRSGFGEAPFGGGEAGGGGGDGLGFGGDSFGEFDFGDGGDEGDGGSDVPLLVVGFDSTTRLPPVSFALEVWSKLAGEACADGTRRYGYTVFPFLRGGRLTGFKFENGLVSFNIRGAQTRRGPQWVVGPYDLEGPHERLLTPVSGNTFYRQMITTALPPVELDGVQEMEDVIDGGTATLTTDDVIDGGTAASTSDWIIYGGQAV